MFSFEWSDGWTPLFVHLASLAYVVAFLSCNQMILRLLVLVGTTLELAYFYLIADKPLWDAILWSVIFCAANVFTLWRIMRDERLGTLTDDELSLHAAIPGIEPKDFRSLLGLAELHETRKIEVLTEENAPVRSLYFILDGGVRMAKSQAERLLPAGIFIGEIAYLLQQKASATVRVGAGTRYLRWNAADLHTLAKGREGLRNALEAAFNRDLAAKVAASP